ncbi:MAG: CPBP family intramembrane metalloprotease [Lachnospiraceae bacterium]|nr:CPBP family intramembrane metalloprotease [Lachnospiraceae bacterium]
MDNGSPMQPGQFTQQPSDSQPQPEAQIPYAGQSSYSEQTSYAGQDPYAVQPPYYAAPPMYDMKPHRRNFSRIGFSYTLFSIVTYSLQIAAGIVIRLVAPSLLDNYLALILFSIIPMYLFAAPATALSMKRVPSEKPERKKYGPAQLIGGFFVVYAAVYAGNFIGIMIGTMIESMLPWARAATNQVQDLATEGEMAVNIVVMVFIGPVIEELLFRKLLCDRLRIYGEFTAVLISGLMFGLFHGNVTQGIYATLFGFALAFIYLKSGNIYITIGYHMAVNFIGGVIAVLVNRALDITEFLELSENADYADVVAYVENNIGGFVFLMGYVAFSIGSMIAGLVIFIVCLATGRIKFAQGRVKLPEGRRFSTMIVNFGMISFLAICAFEIFMSFFT